MNINPLTPEQQAALEDGLDLAARVSGARRPLSSHDLQTLYEVVRDQYRDHQAVVIAVGLAFGEAIQERADLEWVRVRDQYGEETALAAKGSQITCFPVSMIQKRIDAGEAVDIAALRDQTLKQVSDMVASEKYGAR
jgi:hypothetical protein